MTDIDPRQLNAALAVGLGWREVGPTLIDGGLTGLRPRPRRYDYTDYGRIPDYCGSWQAMGELVEVMRKRGWWCRITSPFYAPEDVKQPNEGWWFGGFTPLGMTGWNGRPDHQAGADTAPRAVALAAARALGVSLEGMDGGEAR